MDIMTTSFKIQGYRIFKSTKSGYYYVEIRRGLERSLKTKNGDDAKTIARSLIRQISEKKTIILRGNKDKKISDYLEDYIFDREDLAEKTINLDRTAVNCFIDVIGDIPIANVRDLHFKKFRRIHEYYFKRGRKNRGKISKTSVNTYLRHLKTFFRQAKEDGCIVVMPKIKMIKVGKKLPRILNDSERKELLDYAMKKNFEMHRIMTFALFTGCRVSEIHAAVWENYDWEKRMLKVVGKGSKERNVPIIQEALQAMGKRKPAGYIFWQVGVEAYTKSFKRFARALKIKGVHFHTLRHSAATEMLSRGIPLTVIQKILGHSQISTTQIYAQVLDAKMVEEMQKLSQEK